MVEVRLLGELEALNDGALCAVRGAKQRALLALLALHRGEPVSPDRLIDVVWGDALPANPANALQAQIAQLRRSLGSGAIVTTDAGYALNVVPTDVDSVRFEQLIGDARRLADQGDWAAVSSTLGQALALRRGEPLGEFAYSGFADAERARLEELTLSAIETQALADLALGRHEEIVGSLEVLCRQHPLREQLWESLVLALYRSGRQAEALRAYAEARSMLIEELGIEPGEALRDLEGRILAQDPSLGVSGIVAPAGMRAGRQRRRSQIPVPLTPMIGREKELAELRAAVEANRLVTIVGPGGVGKTRLAMEIARSFHDSRESVAWFVELAPIGDPDSVVAAILASLEVPDLPGGEASGDQGPDRLIDFLSGKEAVLVLDNCEHVIEAAARVVASVISSCPDSRVLVTSREVLGVPGEQLWAAPPLSPDAAVALFVERASAANPAFSPRGDAEAVVAEICKRVDGLPLAIELAAARVRAFPLGQIAARLDDRFRLLSAGARTAEARQQSLRAVVDWSYELLFEDERRLFERLSVFSGGCQIDGACAVCADEQLPADDIPDLLARLVDKSVLVVDQTGPEARFSMLQTLAEYARERLAPAGDGTTVRGRHRCWFAQLAGRSYEAFKGHDHLGWVRSMGIEMDNLRTALACASDFDDAESALLIAGGLGWYWQECGRASEGLRWLDTAFACKGKATPATRCHALAWRKVLSRHAGLADPGPTADELVGLAARAKDPELVAWMRTLVANLALSRGDVQGATDLFGLARAFYASQNDPYGDSTVAFIDANLALLAGDNAAAEQHWTTLAALSRDTGSITYESFADGQLSNMAESRGDYQRAAELLRESMRMTAEMGFHARDVTNVVRLANLAGLMGDPDRASTLFAEAEQAAADEGYGPVVARALTALVVRHRHTGRLDLAEDAARRALVFYRAAGFDSGVIGSLCTLGFISEIRGQAAQAESFHREALAVARKLPEPKGLALCLEGLAGIALLDQNAPKCASLLGASSRLRGGPGVPPNALAELSGTLLPVSSGFLDDRFDAERIEAVARKVLGDPEFEAAFAAGSVADFDELISG